MVGAILGCRPRSLALGKVGARWKLDILPLLILRRLLVVLLMKMYTSLLLMLLNPLTRLIAILLIVYFPPLVSRVGFGILFSVSC